MHIYKSFTWLNYTKVSNKYHRPLGFFPFKITVLNIRMMILMYIVPCYAGPCFTLYLDCYACHCITAVQVPPVYL